MKHCCVHVSSIEVTLTSWARCLLAARRALEVGRVALPDLRLILEELVQLASANQTLEILPELLDFSQIMHQRDLLVELEELQSVITENT